MNTIRFVQSIIKSVILYSVENTNIYNRFIFLLCIHCILYSIHRIVFLFWSYNFKIQISVRYFL